MAAFVMYHDLSITFSGKLKCPEHHLLAEIYMRQLASEWELNAMN